jgi:hypothetical protein
MLLLLIIINPSPFHAKNQLVLKILVWDDFLFSCPYDFQPPSEFSEHASLTIISVVIQAIERNGALLAM